MSDAGTNGNSSPLLCSDSRSQLCEWVDAVPWWKRWLLCRVLYRRYAKQAAALNVAAGIYMLESDGQVIGELLMKRADDLWAEIYSYHPNANDDRHE